MRILLVEDDLLAEALVKPSLTNAMSSMLPLMAKRVGNSWKLLFDLLDVMLPKLNGKALPAVARIIVFLFFVDCPRQQH